MVCKETKKDVFCTRLGNSISATAVFLVGSSLFQKIGKLLVSQLNCLRIVDNFVVFLSFNDI